MRPFGFALCAASIGVLLAACETALETQAQACPQVQGTPEKADKFFVAGRSARGALHSRQAIQDTLEEFPPTNGGNSPRNIRERIERLLSENPVKSIGAIYGDTYLRAALGTMPQDEDKRNVTLSAGGQITHYGFDEDNGSGCLQVTTRFTKVVGNGPPQTEAYRWKESVQAGGFEVHEKDPDWQNPFPNVDLNFSQPMKERIDREELDYKLWAGNGNLITVDKVEYKAPGSSQFVELDPLDPEYDHLYETDQESCIDILFHDYPPAELDVSQDGPLYCLGRCGHPPLINTF